jgi:hypothetical protein
MNVHALPDRTFLNARGNLDKLIAQARKSKVFGGTFDFDASIWDLAPVKPARPSAGSAKAAKLYFTEHRIDPANRSEERRLLAQPFADFVKAVTVMREESRKRTSNNHAFQLTAARTLYEVMSDSGRDPVNLVSADFVAAGNDIKTRQTERGDVTAPGAAYRLGLALVEFARIINRHNLSKVRISFSNPFSLVQQDRVDEKALEEQARRMASNEEVGAIIDASLMVRRRDSDPDLLRMSAVEILACAPVRINEMLDMRADCRRTERHKKGDDELGYVGYAYDGSKGAPDSTKWIPRVMVPIFDRALSDIKRITEPYRQIARWMEKHPGRAFVAEPWRLADPETLLRSREVAEAVGLSHTNAAMVWLKGSGIRGVGDGDRKRYRLGDIEEVILGLQEEMPDPKRKLYDYMFVVPRHFFQLRDCAQEHTLTVVRDKVIGNFLGASDASIFDRLDIKKANGKSFKIRTNALRHFLNTTAQAGFLSQPDIARWSGRKDVGQNAAYDHTGGRHLGRELRRMIDAEEIEGAIVETVASLPPVDREAFLKSRFETAHFTSLGACVQNFSMAPCPSHGGCAGCSEHLVIKGKPGQQAEAERLLLEHQMMLEVAQSEMVEGTYNTSVWVEHNERIVDGLKKTIAVHQNPDIADGTVVQI